MSVADELTHYRNGLEDAYTAAYDMLAVMPTHKNLDSLPMTIRSILGIPRELEDGHVYSSPTHTFAFTLPEYIDTIDVGALHSAFEQSLIRELNLPHIKEVRSEGLSNVCSQCPRLESVNLSGVENIEGRGMASAFYAYRPSSHVTDPLTSINLSSVKTVGRQGLQAFVADSPSITSVDLSSLETVDYQGMLNFATGSSISGGLDLSSLISIESYGLETAYRACPITSVDLSSLTTVKSHGLDSAFSYTQLVTVTFTSLTDISDYGSMGNKALTMTFAHCSSLTSVSFPALTPSSFGNGSNHFDSMLSGCSDVTVHFPAAVQSTIGSWASVTSGFGGTNTTVLFDL